MLSARTLALCGLVLASLAVFGGCAGKNDAGAQSSANQKPAVTSVSPRSDVVTLREGDVVMVSFPSSPNLDSTQAIRRDGKISLQLVGDVQAAGLTIDQLQDSLIKLYAPQIGSKQVTVELQSSSFPVFVTGAVIKPGKVLSDHPITALEAIMEAGGFDYTTADTRAVRIIRNDNGVMKHFTINLQRVLDGKSSTAFYVQPDDIIYVAQRFELF